MSAAPRFNAALGRLRLRRVAFARLARIHEAQVAGVTPDLSRMESPWAERVSMLLLLAALLERCDIDPAAELRGVLDKRIKRALKATSRLRELAEEEKKRRRKRYEPGLSAKEREVRAARHKSNEAHRKALRLALAELARLERVQNACERVLASPPTKRK